jgi:hypothetical protein
MSGKDVLNTKNNFGTQMYFWRRLLKEPLLLGALLIWFWEWFVFQ